MSFRTTIQLDEDVYRAARSLASTRRLSLGAIVSDLARKGLQPHPQARSKRQGGFPTFDVPADAPPLTSEMVRAALEDDEVG